MSQYKQVLSLNPGDVQQRNTLRPSFALPQSSSSVSRLSGVHCYVHPKPNLLRHCSSPLKPNNRRLDTLPSLYTRFSVSHLSLLTVVKCRSFPRRPLSQVLIVRLVQPNNRAPSTLLGTLFSSCHPLFTPCHAPLLIIARCRSLLKHSCPRLLILRLR